MATRKRTVKSTASKAPKRKRAAGKRRQTSAGAGALQNITLPFFLSFCMLVCLAVFGYMGYRLAVESDFFTVKSVRVNGVQRSDADEISRIVKMETERSGTWNADLDAIKAKVDKVTFVKSAAVSRVLPSGIIVTIEEKIPVAIVRRSDGEMLVDKEGSFLAKRSEVEPELPFAIVGWNDEKSENADKENLRRLEMYKKMVDEWRQFDLAARVKYVDFTDVRSPKAVTEDSGKQVSLEVKRENFGENLQKGIEAIVGKGNTFAGVEFVGNNLRLVPREQAVIGENR